MVRAAHAADYKLLRRMYFHEFQLILRLLVSSQKDKKLVLAVGPWLSRTPLLIVL
jgi:hypothetical protein